QPKLGSPYYKNPTLRNVEPRVGFAWDPFRSRKTAVRGAFGVYDVLPLPYEFELLSLLSAPIFQQGNLATLNQGTFPTGAYPLLTGNRLRYGYVQPDPKRNYVMQWNLNVQREGSLPSRSRGGMADWGEATNPSTSTSAHTA